MNTAITTLASPEAGMLAAELAAAYRRMVEHYRQYYKLTVQEAVARTEALADPEHQEMILTRPAADLSWVDLHILAEHDPALAQRRWQEVVQAAEEELRGKTRAAKALEGYGGDAWERAQFFVLRRELGDGWEPRNGIERQLLDMMAQAQTAMFGWLTKLSLWSSCPAKNDQSEGASWSPPRLTEAEAIKEAAGMVERFHRIFTRSLRTLRDLRRCPLAVVVQNAGQVNVGAQQVNVGS